MAKKTNLLTITNFDVSKHEILVFSSSLLIVGVAIVGLSWYFNGGSFSSSPIMMVETVSGDPNENQIIAISETAIKDVGPMSATITWSLSGTAPSVIRYGVRQDQLVARADIPAGQTELTLTELAPRTRYFFNITAAPGTEASNSTSTYSFITTAR